MNKITTFTNSFVLQEIDGNGNVKKELGFRKGGLSYRIENNNVKFYLVEDYFYKNVIWSADVPLMVDGVLYDINALPSALKKIFIQEQGSGSTIDIDHELNPQSDNPVANSTLTPIITSIEDDVAAIGQQILGIYTKTEVDTLLDSYLTKLEANQIVSKYADVSGDVLVLNSENIGV